MTFAPELLPSNLSRSPLPCTDVPMFLRNYDTYVPIPITYDNSVPITYDNFVPNTCDK